MGNNFTHYWTNKTWDADRPNVGQVLEHLGGNEFVSSGVKSGDRVYAVTSIRGKLYLGARLTVDRITGLSEAKRLYRDAWEDGAEHIVGRDGTPQRFDLAVPEEVTRKLRFVNGNGIRPLVIDKDGRLDKQTLRGVRRLTTESAELLDQLLLNVTNGIGRSDPFVKGTTYRREDIYRILGVPSEKRRGDWETGYTQWDQVFYVFANVGVAGRTGDHHDNYREGASLIWHAKRRARLHHAQIRKLISGRYEVRLFTRGDDRDPFTYEGRVLPAHPKELGRVQVTWLPWEADADTGASEPTIYPDEVASPARFEGATKRVTVNAYERDERARAECIRYHTARCSVCNLLMAERYGTIAEGFIHVHHLKPLGDIRQEYQVDPVADLRPVCPNCHAMLHRSRPPLSIAELKERLIPPK